MDMELDYPQIPEDLELASFGDALFEQYDEAVCGEQANDECYENLYPTLA